GILRRGLGYRKCSVGAVLNIQSDHLGLKGVDTLDQLAEVKRVVIGVASDTAVLSADDPRCLRMAAHTHAKHVCYVSVQTQFPLVKTPSPARGPRPRSRGGGKRATTPVVHPAPPPAGGCAPPPPPPPAGGAPATTCRTRCSPPPSPTPWGSRSRTCARG